MRVLLIEPVLAHYRKDVYHILSGCEKIDMYYFAGRNYQGIKSINPKNAILSNYRTAKLLHHKFYYLKQTFRIVRRIKPDLILCTGVDFHLIHSIALFLFHRIITRKKFYWWSHATLGRQGRVGVVLRRFIYRKSTGILAYSQKGKKRLLDMGVKEENITVVNNSINVEDYGFINYNILHFKRNQKFTLLYSGRLLESKKVDLLIHALARLRNQGIYDFVCYIIGNGDGRIDKLQQLASENGVLENIVFTGALYGQRNHKYFQMSDLFVSPGGIGLSIVHAMSFGLPVITTDDIENQGPEFELLIPGRTGETFKSSSVEDLAEKIIHWRNMIRQNGDKIKKDCIQRIKDKGYMPDKQAKKVIEFILRTGQI